MQHNYTNSELDTAVGESFDITGDAPLLDVSFNGLRKFLDALPEPQDEWEACDFEDIRKGDRVRIVRLGRTTDFHWPVIETHGTFLVLQDHTQCSNFHKAVYYRIPAPVTHPDPMEHHIITCHDRENDYFWNGVTGKYMGLYDPRNLYSREDFINWSPAKVVADNA